MLAPMTKKATPRLSRLLDRVERVCANKSALARFLGVSSSHIQKWVTARDYEPGGEVTLALLEWVEAAEDQQNESSGRAETQPEPVAQLKKSSYEKPKPGPHRACHK